MVKTAGILTIISGCIGICIGVYAAVLGKFMGGMAGLADMCGLAGMGGLAGIFAAFGGAAIGIGVVALIAGIFTLKRKAWGFALAGAICALFPVVPLGVLAIIFVSMGKTEFA